MKLVTDARNGWRWFSVQAMTVALALQGAWMALPEDMKATVPDTLVSWVTMALLVLGALGRFVDQGGRT
jgi:hypothetical protein